MQTLSTPPDSGAKKAQGNLGLLQKPSVAVVIAAGGIGRRMSAQVPKQFLEIAGKPILLHTVESVSLLDEANQIIVSLPAEFIEAANEIFSRCPMRLKVECVPGGATRQDSVRCGVARVRPEAHIIMVHDAVRPLCDLDTMRRVLNAAWQKGAAVPGLPATETIQRVSRRMRVLSTPPREELYAIQTPQAFRTGILVAALEKAYKAGYVGTDESSVVRWAGHPVTVVPGCPDNIKITRPLDLDLAEIILKARERAREREAMDKLGFRIGHGIDYHRLAHGRKLILGGVELPFDKGLEGYSDADALCHAVCDALLGAAGLGDIGRHFPDSDPSNRDRSSLQFLRAVRVMVEQAGWSIRNIDATLIMQQPKLAPFASKMRENLAQCLGLDPADVNVKATTTEGMNAEGRGEGISAQAIALLQKK